jgi:acetolactate synthase-1/2/3 large subunit
MKKYSDLICHYLQEMGYTHCFFVAGGNIMHLIGSASEKFVMIPVVNEVAAGIAVEYFNASQNGKKAFALVTAGPGLTNMVTAIAGAYLESRELLVIGGQVKTGDLMSGKIRQRGIQEINGMELVKSICKLSIRLDCPLEKNAFIKSCEVSSEPRMGPVFIEIPLDVQAKVVDTKITLTPLVDPVSFEGIGKFPAVEHIRFGTICHRVMNLLIA